MLKFASAIAASTAILALTSVPAFAGETLTMTSMMVADIGHDVTAVAEHAHKDAKIVDVVSAEVPPFETIAHYGGTTLVEISLDTNGSLTKTMILKSSGHAGLDQSALVSVRQSKYAPESVNGSPVAGDYTVEVTFNASE